MPAFRVPVVMVHMAGLRNGPWGRRGVMRALGVWHESADTVATADWVSVRSPRLLLVEGSFVSRFGSMAAFDREQPLARTARGAISARRACARELRALPPSRVRQCRLCRAIAAVGDAAGASRGDAVDAVRIAVGAVRDGAASPAWSGGGLRQAQAVCVAADAAL